MIKFLVTHYLSVKLLNGGSNFDVINLPKVVIPQVGSGTTALVQPVVVDLLKKF